MTLRKEVYLADSSGDLRAECWSLLRSGEDSGGTGNQNGGRARLSLFLTTDLGERKLGVLTRAILMS